MNILTHFVVWINKTPGYMRSPVLHKEVWKATDPDLIKKQHGFAAKAKNLTGDGSFFFQLITTKAAQAIKTY